MSTEPTEPTGSIDDAPDVDEVDDGEDVEQPRTMADPLPDGEDVEQPRTMADPPAEDEAIPADFTYDYVGQVHAAEAAAQRSVCRMPDDGEDEDDLVRALDLRVQVNLDQADGVTVTRVGSAHPEVRALEAPYRIGTAREIDPVSHDARGGQKRPATPATANPATAPTGKKE